MALLYLVATGGGRKRTRFGGRRRKARLPLYASSPALGVHHGHVINPHLAGAAGVIGAVAGLPQPFGNLFVALHIRPWRQLAAGKGCQCWLPQQLAAQVEAGRQLCLCPLNLCHYFCRGRGTEDGSETVFGRGHPEAFA